MNLLVDRHPIDRDIECVRTVLDRLDRGQDIFGLPDFERGHGEAEYASRRLNLVQLLHNGGIADIDEDRQSAERWDSLAQKFESLGSDFSVLARQAREVATRSPQTRNQTVADRVCRPREDNWDERCCPLCGCGCRGSRRENDIDLEPNELGRELGVALAAPLRPTILEREGAAFNPAELAQSLSKSRARKALVSRRPRANKTDDWQLRLLRACHCRPRRRAAEQRDELAPPHHSITSSARSRIAVGSSMPIALAVLRLTTSSNFVGSSTGSSAGLAPCSALATMRAS